MCFSETHIGYEKMPVWQCQQKSPRRLSDSNMSLRTTCQLGVNVITSHPRRRNARRALASTVGRMKP